MAADQPENLSITEYAVLGLLSEGPTHGFAIARDLAPDGEVGRLFTVRRPLVYRAIDRLVEAGYVEPVSIEQELGPKRVILATTFAGRANVSRWLEKPVEHVRDLRIEFLLKLTLLVRSGRSPLDLIRRQRATLEETIDALDGPASGPPDHVELWRIHNAAAVSAYLRDLERRYSVTE